MSAHHCQQHLEIRVPHIFQETLLLYCKSTLRRYLISKVSEKHIAELILRFIDILHDEAELLVAFGSFLVGQLYLDARHRQRDEFPKMAHNRKLAAKAVSPIFPFLHRLLLKHPHINATPLYVDPNQGTHLFIGQYEISFKGYKCKMEFGIEEGDWMSFVWYFQHPWLRSWDSLAPHDQAREHCWERADFWGVPNWFNCAGWCSNGYWDLQPKWDIPHTFYTLYSLASKRLGPLSGWEDVTMEHTDFEYGDCGQFWWQGSWTAPPRKKRKIMYMSY